MQSTGAVFFPINPAFIIPFVVLFVFFLFEFSMRQSKAHQAYLVNNGLEEQTVSHMSAASTESHDRQKEIEVSDDLIFDDFLTQWNDA